MGKIKEVVQRGAVRFYGDELREAFYDYCQKIDRKPNEAGYNILRDFLIEHGYEVPPYKGKGGFNQEKTAAVLANLEKTAENMRLKKAKTPHFISMGRELLEKYNKNLQTDDMEVKKLTIQDMALMTGFDVEALRPYFQKRAILEVDPFIVSSICLVLGCKSSDLIKEIK